MNISPRLAGIVGIAAGLAYFSQAVLGLLPSGTLAGILQFLPEAVYILALLATGICLAGLHSFGRQRYGMPGTIGFWSALVGTALMILSGMGTIFSGASSPASSFLGGAFLAGILFTLVGYAVLGVTCWRSGTLPAWLSLALILGFPFSIALNPLIGGVLFSLTWIALGFLLLKK